MVRGRVSVIISGRTERYFQETIDSALERATGDVEIIAIVDCDEPPDKPLEEQADPRVKLIKLDKAIGQRAAYNLGVRESSGQYVMKIDAHALMSPGYDEELKAHCPSKTVVLPEMRRLNVHQWKDKPRGKTRFMFFGLDLYCHYWRDYRKRPEARVEYPEVMTGQGSCWFTTREWNDYIGLLDEGVGSWGNVGIEVSLRTWLSGGSLIVNPKAWQAHWFRKDEGGFPYPMSGRHVARAHRYTREHYYFKDDAFERQVRPFSWLIEKFAPVPGWEAYMTDQFRAPRVVVYYTDSKLDPRLANAVRSHLKKVVGPIPIVSVSQKSLKFGRNICVGDKPKVYQSMYEQLLTGLEATAPESIVYCCEHDVFYHPSHFAFLPKSKEHAYFNTNRYHWRLGMRSFLKARGKRAMSQCIAYREMLIAHCKQRLAAWEKGPTRMRIRFHNFESERPNVDIRHGDNLTSDGDYKRNWQRGKTEGVVNLPGWGRPRHFQNRVGYKETIRPKEGEGAAAYLHRSYRRWFPQVSPVRIPGMKRKQLGNIFRALGYKKGAEIGVRKGEFSQHLCHAVPNLELTCVDLWDAYYHFDAKSAAAHHKEARERLARYRVNLVKKLSRQAAFDVPDESLDFVYIDADHRFDFVMEDLIAWGRKVRSGGIISGHDYYRFRNAGVVQAVDLYTRMHGIEEWFITDEKEASFFWVKP